MMSRTNSNNETVSEKSGLNVYLLSLTKSLITFLYDNCKVFQFFLSSIFQCKQLKLGKAWTKRVKWRFNFILEVHLLNYTESNFDDNMQD